MPNLHKRTSFAYTKLKWDSINCAPNEVTDNISPKSFGQVVGGDPTRQIGHGSFAGTSCQHKKGTSATDCSSARSHISAP